MSKYDMYREENKRNNDEILNNIGDTKKEVRKQKQISKEVKDSVRNISKSIFDGFWC